MSDSLTYAGLLVAQSGLVRLGEPPSVAFFVTRLLPVVACSAGTLFFGNIAYLHLSVTTLPCRWCMLPSKNPSIGQSLPNALQCITNSNICNMAGPSS